MGKELVIVNMKDKLLMIWAVVLITAVLVSFGFYLGNKTSSELKEEDPFIMVDASNTGFTVDWPETTSILFGDDVGKLTWEDDKMKFEGDAYESAKIFFDYFLIMYIDDYIEARIEEGKGLSIDEPEMILFEFAAKGEFAKEFKPQLFLKVTNIDLSKCFINDRLRLDLNGKIYWIRSEK